MHEPPANLSNDAIREGVRDSYGLEVVEITFLPLGLDSSAWVYRIRAADADEYFLKARTGAVNEPGLLVPHFLRDQGIAGVVAPLPTCSGALWALIADYALILYPFIEGRTGMEAGLSDRQWVEFGTSLRQVHEFSASPGARAIVAARVVYAGGSRVNRAVGRPDRRAHIRGSRSA